MEGARERTEMMETLRQCRRQRLIPASLAWAFAYITAPRLPSLRFRQPTALAPARVLSPGRDLSSTPASAPAHLLVPLCCFLRLASSIRTDHPPRRRVSRMLDFCRQCGRVVGMYNSQHGAASAQANLDRVMNTCGVRDFLISLSPARQPFHLTEAVHTCIRMVADAHPGTYP